jgi:hypothetical protein
MILSPLGKIYEGVDDPIYNLIYMILFGQSTEKRPKEFDVGTKYKRGNLIYYNNKIYGAKKDDIEGPFDINDWYEISLVEARGVQEVDLNNLIVSSLLSL